VTADSGRDLVTGALSYSGSAIAARILAQGRQVRTLTSHPDRPDPLAGRVETVPYRFDDPAELARSMEGITTLYNTYWVRFSHGGTTFDEAVANSQLLFEAARRARVARIVHVSVSNPSLGSPLPYFRGKAEVEDALTRAGVPYTVVRPTWIFGGRRELLANNIGWILRHFPVFPLPGDGRYRIQPVHIDDFARICQEAAQAEGGSTVDAAGPEILSFEALVRGIRQAVGSHSPIVHVSPRVMMAASRGLGALIRDVVLTREEILGLMAELLVSDAPPRGEIGFSQWLAAEGSSLGCSYVNELRNHFSSRAR
jgi:NADH dehydrogenase